MAGDDDALELLVRAYHDRVYKYGLRVCRNAHDAEDAVQEAFMTLGRRPDVVRDPSALSWLMTVVRNVCRRFLRIFLREPLTLRELTGDSDIAEGASEEHLHATESASAALERWRLVRQVHRAIATLDPPYREVLVMRDVEGLPGEEVCGALGLTTPAMKSRLHRARQMVRERILEWRAETDDLMS
jgi:RNA polymerase sigma-70 factor (ECF subfamily)